MNVRDLKFYTEDAFLPSENDAVFYGFFSRLGGVSASPCTGLNCGLGSKDLPEHVKQNRALVAARAGARPEHLLSVYQVHGSDVVDIDAPWVCDETRPQGDAMVTDKAGIALGIVTADCAPVLFVGQKGGDGSAVIGAAHAGWKGALNGVLGNTVQKMEALGAQDIRACVGPCITRHSYEVSEGFVDPFLDHDDSSERFFSAGVKSGHLMFDLAGYCAFRLAQAGIKKVSLLDIDTYENEEEFFSFRRATHRSEADYGRQISVISIKNL